MTPALRAATWLTTLLVVVTGAVYAIMAWGMTPASPYDVVNHAWQPAVLHAHVLAAPAWLVVFGAAWVAHVRPQLRRADAALRPSGLALLGATAPMVVGGYLLQTAVDDGWRSVWCVVHVAGAAAWTLLFAGHVVLARRWRQASMPSRRSSSAVAASATVPGGCT